MSDQLIANRKYSQTENAIKARSKRLQDPNLLESIRVKDKKRYQKKLSNKFVTKVTCRCAPSNIASKWKEIEFHLRRGRDSGYIALAVGQMQSVVEEYIKSIRLVDSGESTKEDQFLRIKQASYDAWKKQIEIK